MRTHRPAHMESCEPRKLLAVASDFAIRGDEFQSITSMTSIGSDTVIAGIFQQTTTFAPGVTRTAQGEVDSFIARYGSDGSLSQLLTFAGPESDLDTPEGLDDRFDYALDPDRANDSFIQGITTQPGRVQTMITGIAADGAGGYYAVGGFRGTVDFGGQSLATDNAFYDILILHVDAAGTVTRAQQMGGRFNDIALDVKVDSQGSAIVAGYFSRFADMNPTKAVFEVNPEGRSDGFVAKITPAGKLGWLATYGGDAVDQRDLDMVTSIAVDANDNVFVGGTFSRTADFAPGPARVEIEARDGSDMFLTQLSRNGKYIWAQTQGSEAYDGVRKITLGADGGLYTAGYFQEDFEYNPNNDAQFFTVDDTLDNDDTTDLAVSRFSTAGDFIWARQIGGGELESIGGLAANPGGGVTLAGSFSASVDFNPGGGRFVLTSPENSFDDSNIPDRDFAYSGYVVSLGSKGGFVSARQIDGRTASDVYVEALTTNLDGSVTIAGRAIKRVAVISNAFGNGLITGLLGNEEDDAFAFTFAQDGRVV